MNRIAVIATHHKSGTVWMNHTFRLIGQKLGVRFFPALAFSAIPEAERMAPLILTASNKEERIGPELFDREDARIFHLIRDPRDVLISSMHYHLRANERWLLRADPQFDGRNYREVINALPTERARYIFEMQHSTSKNLGNMLDWNYNRLNSMECRYEDIIRDTEGSLFLRVATHLGFSQEELPLCRRMFLRTAIFGGNAKRKEEGKVTHVRSGKPEQWRTVFDRKLGETFLAQLGDALVKLGYEKDDTWLENLPVHRPELDA